MLRFDWAWQPRHSHLPAKAVVGIGEAAFALLDRLQALLDNDIRIPLQVTGFANGFIAFGAQEHLPWFEGAQYAGQDPEAPGLWLPIHLEPDAPLDLIAGALKQKYDITPLLLWPKPQQVVDLRRQFPLDRQILVALATKYQEGRVS